MKKHLIFLLKNTEEIVAGSCLSLMVAITFCNVVERYFFRNPITWADELSAVLSGWAIFLGMSAAYKRNQHMGMEFIINKLKAKNRMFIQQISTIAMTALCGILAFVSWNFVFQVTKRTLIMRLSYRYIYAAAAVGFTFMTYYSLVYLCQSFFAKEVFYEHYDISGYKEEGDDI